MRVIKDMGDKMRNNKNLKKVENEEKNIQRQKRLRIFYNG